MKFAILCLIMAGTVSAAPPFFHYLPHYGGARPSQMTDPFRGGPLAQTGMAPISMEIIFPQRFPGGGTNLPMPGASFPSQAFIKYSIPKAPGRKSVEIYYPYDFSQQKMPNIPQLFPFDYPQAGPQQTPNMQPSYDAMPPQPQNPQQTAQQDQPAQATQPQQVAPTAVRP